MAIRASNPNGGFQKYAYQRIAEDLLRRIRKGEWKEGEQIPPLNRLEELFPESRMTLYKALQHLAERGHLTLFHSRGTFVKASHPRPRIGILTGDAIFQPGAAPFASLAFHHAHARFARHGMDSQLYAEDPSTPSGLPCGLFEELDRGKLAGLLTIQARFPYRHMGTLEWKRHAIPLAHIGAGSTPHSVDVDRPAFLERALSIARHHARRRVALLEKQAHYREHAAHFHQRCAAERVQPCPPPATLPDATLPYEDYGYELLHRVWRAHQKPEAILVPDDVIAKGVAQAALALRIRIPEDLLIVAMTNRGARFFHPVPIIHLEVDVESIVAKAAGMLLDQVKGLRVKPQTILIPPVASSMPRQRVDIRGTPQCVESL